MRLNRRTMVAIAVLLVAGVAGCNDSLPTGAESAEGDRGMEAGESGTQWNLDQTADEPNQGAHLRIKYDAPSNSFIATAENTTNATLRRVRVEVH